MTRFTDDPSLLELGGHQSLHGAPHVEPGEEAEKHARAKVRKAEARKHGVGGVVGEQRPPEPEDDVLMRMLMTNQKLIAMRIASLEVSLKRRRQRRQEGHHHHHHHHHHRCHRHLPPVELTPEQMDIQRTGGGGGPAVVKVTSSFKSPPTPTSTSTRKATTATRTKAAAATASAAAAAEAAEAAAAAATKAAEAAAAAATVSQAAYVRQAAHEANVRAHAERAAKRWISTVGPRLYISRGKMVEVRQDMMADSRVFEAVLNKVTRVTDSSQKQLEALSYYACHDFHLPLPRGGAVPPLGSLPMESHFGTLVFSLVALLEYGTEDSPREFRARVLSLKVELGQVGRDLKGFLLYHRHALIMYPWRVCEVVLAAVNIGVEEAFIELAVQTSAFWRKYYIAAPRTRAEMALSPVAAPLYRKRYGALLPSCLAPTRKCSAMLPGSELHNMAFLGQRAVALASPAERATNGRAGGGAGGSIVKKQAAGAPTAGGGGGGGRSGTEGGGRGRGREGEGGGGRGMERGGDGGGGGAAAAAAPAGGAAAGGAPAATTPAPSPAAAEVSAVAPTVGGAAAAAARGRGQKNHSSQEDRRGSQRVMATDSATFRARMLVWATPAGACDYTWRGQHCRRERCTFTHKHVAPIFYPGAGRTEAAAELPPPPQQQQQQQQKQAVLLPPRPLLRLRSGQH